jgi:hypothetical protein
VARIQEYGSLIASSNAVNVDFFSVPSAPPLDTIGMYATIPFRLLLPAEQFVVAIHANADSYSLDAFQIRILFDPAVLHFERFAQPSSFMCALSRLHCLPSRCRRVDVWRCVPWV